MIQVSDLRKSYGRRPALRGVSFYAEAGRMLALLGPNGAGKSTAIRILSTGMAPDGGLVRLDGLTLGRQDREIRRRIGVVFQTGVLDEALTVEENLLIRGRFYGLRGRSLRQRVLETAETTGASKLLDRRYGQLSGGQRRRCDIARALLPLPKILILDEPTTGLDPEMRDVVWKTIGAVRARTGMTVLLTSHSMEEAAAADRIVILKEGGVAAFGSPRELRARYARDRLVLFSDACGALQSILDARRVRYFPCPGGMEVPLPDTRGALPLLELCRGGYAGFEVRMGSLDDAYLSVMRGGSAGV